jgi:hypothetical protein
MRTLYKHLILTTLLLTLVISTPLLRAEENTGTNESEDHNGNITITNGNLTAIFDGQKPSLRFFFTSNARQTYFLKFNSLTEFNATNGLAFLHNESLAQASLEEANWTHSQFYNASDGALAIDFTTHQLNITPTGHQEDFGSNETSHLSNTTVTITAKLYPTGTDHTVQVGNATFTVHGGVEIKLDISINNWPFINTNDRLALRIDLHSSINTFEVSEHDGDHEINTNQTETGNDTQTGNTMPAPHLALMNETQGNDTDHEISEHQGEGQVQLLTSNGLIGGFFRFVSNAMTDGSSTAVAASYRFEPDEVNSTQHEFKLYLSYHSFTNSLVHDPSFGVVPTPSQSLPVFTALSIVLVGVMSAAVLVAQRKRILR